ncbi:MAG: sulfur carrier protein ThiS [Clostridiales bacterium]
MKVKLNGLEYETNEKTTLKIFLSEKLKSLDKIVVEHNYNIIDKKDLEKIILNDDDIIEVLKFVGGG